MDAAQVPVLREIKHRLQRIAGTGLFLGALVAVGATLRLSLITGQRFHGDEAIYGYWARLVASGRDPLLLSVPLDKPPLFIYLLAGVFKLFSPTEVAARLINEVASVTAVILTYRLGRRFYGEPEALLAAGVMALSPFNLLFAPTTFTDPLMVALSLAAVTMAAAGRWGWAGIIAGLAVATKQQGILFVPLVVATRWIAGQRGRDDFSGPERQIVTSRTWDMIKAGLGFLSVMLLLTGWDALRWQRRASFWEQSAISHGPLHLVSWWELGERLAGWSELLAYIFGSPLLNAILLLGVPLLLWRSRGTVLVSNDEATAILGSTGEAPSRPFSNLTSPARADWLLASFSSVFFLVHWLFSFSVWDRYLLGLVPMVSLLLARVVWRGTGWILHWADRVGFSRLWPEVRPKTIARQDLYPSIGPGRLSDSLDGRALKKFGWAGLMVIVLLAAPGAGAVWKSYPIGGDHGVYQGLEETIAFFRHEVPAGSAVWHRYLGWHYLYYLFDAPLDLRWYADPAALAAKVSRDAETLSYVAFPAWEREAESKMRAALGATGYRLLPQRRVWREDGSHAFTIYRIVSTDTKLGVTWLPENQ